MNGSLAPSGELTMKVMRSERPEQARELTIGDILYYSMPRLGLPNKVNKYRVKNIPNIMRGLWRVAVAKTFNISNVYGSVYAKIYRADGTVEDYGLVSLRVVTTAGVNAIVDAFQNTVEVETFKFHGIGTGTNAEASGDTALQTELTTQYNPDSTRATGSLTEGASANIFRTVGTNTVDASAAVTEHGILTQAATGGGTLLDRSVFSVLNLVSGDSLQTTYDLTFSAGG
jgi:hypothetical protein